MALNYVMIMVAFPVGLALLHALGLYLSRLRAQETKRAGPSWIGEHATNETGPLILTHTHTPCTRSRAALFFPLALSRMSISPPGGSWLKTTYVRKRKGDVTKIKAARAKLYGDKK